MVTVKKQQFDSKTPLHKRSPVVILELLESRSFENNY
jgi:hypothetical protein